MSSGDTDPAVPPSTTASREEVVLGLVFDDRNIFSSGPLFGAMVQVFESWQRWGGVADIVEQAALGRLDGSFPLGVPRLWIPASSGTRGVQLQRDLFHLNLIGAEASLPPEQLVAELFDLWGRFAKAVPPCMSEQRFRAEVSVVYRLQTQTAFGERFGQRERSRDLLLSGYEVGFNGSVAHLGAVFQCSTTQEGDDSASDERVRITITQVDSGDASDIAAVSQWLIDALNATETISTSVTESLS